ncbi:hydrolase [Ascochyta rabiei]|uniref:Hydrolase n=1 Tax=Didymella rabiei TaxID=5454 RepID=A0A162ZMI0_DIDRA|nr:hydrolase [Ascochyta rabiei]
MARIKAVAPVWVDTKLIEGRLDDPKEMWREAQANVPLKKVAQPTDVARAAVRGRDEGRIVWSEEDITQSQKPISAAATSLSSGSLPTESSGAQSTLLLPITRSRPKIRILLSANFDAVSGWLGTGQRPDNNLADYSSGFFSAHVGVHRLLRLFKKLEVQDKLTIAQEREVLEHCITLCQKLNGRRPVGYRSPLYQLRESTVELLEEFSFLYNSSLSHHDSKPYYLPNLPPTKAPTYEAEASAKDWMKPLLKPSPPTLKTLIKIPSNWYAEDMTPMQFWPHSPNSQGFVDARVVENMWKDRFEWIRTEVDCMSESDVMVFPLVLHPDMSGMAHVIGMIERIITYLKGWGMKWSSIHSKLLRKSGRGRTRLSDKVARTVQLKIRLGGYSRTALSARQ